ncbi:hypothetical protein C7212DRAFT_290383 [Tuber magnatum]|uniref:Nucleoporin Pom152 n=1 Tax=Tuber magnatum TaxID=42249 RepID=A0A317T1I0_9PEZI|nr:hypothetical protein C7212DRAFT_290383 [Tuber magnatum]
MSDETPRIPSSFPRSPATIRARRAPPSPSPPIRASPPRSVGATGSASVTSTLATGPRTSAPPSIVQTGDVTLPPLISLDTLDAPTQRLYAVGFFVLLQAWKFYDIARLYTTDGDSISELWFCSKWLVLDGCFFWFLPLLRIPWLTFTPNFTLRTIAIFSVVDIFFSLKYEIPLAAILGGLWKFVYDREVSISEKSVKWYDIVNNNSHIQGKYTVHILPEGAVKLNPNANCFCLGEGVTTIDLPIRINGTNPIHIQLARIDFDTGGADMIDISTKDIKKMLKRAEKGEDPKLHVLSYLVKQPGLYRLTKVTDVTQMDVRIYRSEALVVSCPKATLKVSPTYKRNKCKGDMSDLALQVEGLAPLQITYSREMKGKPTVFTVQSIHPENFESPLLAGFSSDGTLAEQGDASLSWAQRQNIPVPLNESLGSSGDWAYSVDKVSDACGNAVDYNAAYEDGDYVVPKRGSLSQSLKVHDRPLARFLGCDPQHPMDLPKGTTGVLPIQLLSGPDDAPYEIEVIFTPYDRLGLASEHASDAAMKIHKLKTLNQVISIKEPGLYNVKTISSDFCSGDVMEPASCLVITPPEPSMAMRSDEILDKCTGSSIGLTIDLTLVGAPPFELSYRLVKDNGNPVVKTLTIERTRHQVQFTPADAGHYAYEFFSLRDKNYANIKIDPKINHVEQTVKPMAGAIFVDPSPRKKACIDQPVEFDVKMQGMPPLTLNYELIHNGKRTKMTEPNITTGIHTIRTPPLANGGEYALALTTVEDESGCQIFVGSEAKIDVRWQRPKAQFSSIEGKMSVRALEGKTIDIPLRLTGESPWDVSVRNLDSNEPARQLKFSGSNAYLTVRDPGRYKLESVHDNGCPGTITESDSTFLITWIARPMLKLAESSSTTKGDVFTRKDVCEGDEDAIELAFVGSPPFTIDYERTFRPEGYDLRRALDPVPQKLTAGLGVATVRLETSQAGVNRYKFSRIADSLYDNPRESLVQNPVILEQTIHSRPSTSFANPSKVYKYCLDAGAGDDIIPIQLHGKAPFSLTINIKHFNTGKSDVINIPHIDSTIFNFRIPSHALTLGSHAVSVLKVKDARGCVRKTMEGPHVMVAVADMPTISPSSQQTNYCVGDRISFTLSGVPPFAVEYEWNGVLMKAHNQPSEFARVAEKPGNFTITGLQDSASDCKVNVGLTQIVREVPSVRISDGYTVVRGIPEGDQAEIHFDFYGTPPFTFTYTRSEIAKKGSKPRILEMHSQTTDGYKYSMFASQEGTYEVVSIEDNYCSYAAGKANSGRKR